MRFEADGTITMLSGTLDYGQGHATPFAQVLGGKLGIPVPHFRLLQGDSDQLKVGGGTGGSKSALVASQAFLEAGDKVIEQGKQIAAHVLEASAVDIEFARGRFTIAGTDRGIGILELAGKLRSGLKLPADVPQSLDVSHISDNPPFSFPNGCHIAEVEIDRDTGVIEVVRYFMVNDFGTVINPMLVAGQAHGGVMQGIGQALMERTVYDPQGQPVAGSYMDYALPRAVGRARHVGAEPFGAVQDQPAGREGLRRGGLRRRAAVGDERRGRCAVRVRRHPHRHAGDAGEGVAGAERRLMAHHLDSGLSSRA